MKHAHKLHTHTHAHRHSLSGHNFDHANEYRTHMSRLGLYYPLAGRVADLFLHGLHGGKAWRGSDHMSVERALSLMISRIFSNCCTLSCSAKTISLPVLAIAAWSSALTPPILTIASASASTSPEGKT